LTVYTIILSLCFVGSLIGHPIEWLRRYHSERSAYGCGVTYDTRQGLTIVGNDVDSAGGRVLVVRYSAKGETLGTFMYDGGHSACGYQAATAGDGTMLVAGGYYDDTIDLACLLAKFALDGETLWVKRVRLADQDYFMSVSLGPSKSAIAAGSSYSYSGGGSPIGLLSSYDSTGALRWAHTDTWAREFYGTVTVGGIIYVSGTDTLGRMLVMRCDSAGDTVWTVRNSWGGMDCCGWAVAADSQGGVAVAGYASDGVNSKITVIKCDTGGHTLWTRALQPTGNDWATGIAADSAGDLFVCGVCGSSEDYLLSKFSPAGETMWTTTYNNGGSDEAHGVVVVDADPIVTGSSGSGSSSDIVTIRYSNSDGLAERAKDNAPPVHNASGLLGSYNMARDVVGVQMQLPSQARGSLCVCDITGRTIATLARGTLIAGRREFVWDTRACAAGIYFATLRTPEYSENLKLIIVR